MNLIVLLSYLIPSVTPVLNRKNQGNWASFKKEATHPVAPSSCLKRPTRCCPRGGVAVGVKQPDGSLPRLRAASLSEASWRPPLHSLCLYKLRCGGETTRSEMRRSDPSVSAPRLPRVTGHGGR